ncbi:MAG: hypothetical protein V4534_04630 [Myxococcota bacterium]
MRSVFIDACVDLLEKEVKATKGLTGLTAQHAYGLVCALKPDAPHRAVDYLMDDFILAYQKTQPDPKAVAAAWLAITDERVKERKHPLVTKLYKGLRPRAQPYVELAVPKFATLVEQFQFS